MTTAFDRIDEELLSEFAECCRESWPTELNDA